MMFYILGSGFFDAFTAIYCNFWNFGSGFLGRTTAKKYVFSFLGRYFYFQYRSSSLLISGKVEITADNTVKKALPISLKTELSAGNTVKKALPNILENWIISREYCQKGTANQKLG